MAKPSLMTAQIGWMETGPNFTIRKSVGRRPTPMQYAIN